jgi:hypothetical protein
MKLTIHPEKFLEIIKKSYSLDIIYLLKLIEQNYDVSELCKENVLNKTHHGRYYLVLEKE